MKKVVLFFLFALTCIAMTGNMLRSSSIEEQLPKQKKQLCYTITSDSQSPVELKQVNFLPSSITGNPTHQKTVQGSVVYVSYRVTLKHQNSQYALFIKDVIGGPVFLRNNCLRI